MIVRKMNMFSNTFLVKKGFCLLQRFIAVGTCHRIDSDRIDTD